VNDTWETISALATGVGTLVLAVATFSAVRATKRSVLVAEEALLAGIRPLVVQSLTTDPVHKALWSDRHVAVVEGGKAVFEVENGIIYLAMGLRNVGSGIALLHGWHVGPDQAFSREDPVPPDEFRRLSIDLYIASGGSGYWESAVREPDDPARLALLNALEQREPIRVDLLYGDQQGGQRTISRFTILPAADDGWYCQVSRHWNVDRPAPR
jgi:hypothetical protein